MVSSASNTIDHTHYYVHALFLIKRIGDHSDLVIVHLSVMSDVILVYALYNYFTHHHMQDLHNPGMSKVHTHTHTTTVTHVH